MDVTTAQVKACLADVAKNKKYEIILDLKKMLLSVQIKKRRDAIEERSDATEERRN